MKNNKIDSDILDDNYFPEEEKKPSKIEKTIRSFFKIIGFSTINITFYIFSIIFLFVTIYPALNAQNIMSKNSVIFFTLFLSYCPFIFLLYWQIKKENFLESNSQIWTSLLTSCLITFISILTYNLCYFRYA